jgi:hypothetical protein
MACWVMCLQLRHAHLTLFWYLPGLNRTYPCSIVLAAIVAVATAVGAAALSLVLLSLCVCGRSLSLVLWTPLGDGERRWDGGDKVVVVVVVLGLCIHKQEAGEEVGD